MIVVLVEGSMEKIAEFDALTGILDESKGSPVIWKNGELGPKKEISSNKVLFKSVWIGIHNFALVSAKSIVTVYTY